MGIGSDDEMREVLVVRDVATRVIAAIPTMSRYTEDVVEALKRLFGRRKVKLACSDVALEFAAAMSQLNDPHRPLPARIAKEQLIGRTNEPGSDQHCGYLTIARRTTGAVLAFCIKLCHTQPEHRGCRG